MWFFQSKNMKERVSGFGFTAGFYVQRQFKIVFRFIFFSEFRISTVFRGVEIQFSEVQLVVGVFCFWFVDLCYIQCDVFFFLKIGKEVNFVFGEDLDYVFFSEFLKQIEQFCWVVRGFSQLDLVLDFGVGFIAFLCKVVLRIVNNFIFGFLGKIVSSLREVFICCYLVQFRVVRK